jgi:hypothetical protein
LREKFQKKTKEMQAMIQEGIIRKEQLILQKINKKEQINFKLIDMFHQKKEFK